MGKKLTTIRLDDDLHQWIKKYAKENRTNVTAIIVKHICDLKRIQESVEGKIAEQISELPHKIFNEDNLKIYVAERNPGIREIFFEKAESGQVKETKEVNVV